MVSFSKTLLLGVAERVIINAVELLKKAGQPDKCGGYFSAVNVSDGSLEIIARIGFSPEEKIKKRVEISWEKCHRLHGFLGDLTSYHSRNPRFERWGGAVRGQNLILGFSGLPELWDEAAMFVTAIILRELDKDEVLARISEERNPHLRPLLAICNWVEQSC